MESDFTELGDSGLSEIVPTSNVGAHLNSISVKYTSSPMFHYVSAYDISIVESRLSQLPVIVT